LVPHHLFLISPSLSANDSIFMKVLEVLKLICTKLILHEYTRIGLNGGRCLVNTNNLLRWACGFLCVARSCSCPS
jgi:hypothetical protein